MSDDAKRAILARRAKFVAAAIAGLGAACGKEPKGDDAGAPPGPCLSVYVAPDAGAPDAQRPRACLSAPMPRDASRLPCNCAPGDPLCSCL
jgi:hypothetical protein